MEFLAAVIAIVAIILAFRLRKRVTALETHVTLLNGRLEARPEGVPQTAPKLPEQPATPESQETETVAPVVSAPQSPPTHPDHAATDPASTAAYPAFLAADALAVFLPAPAALVLLGLGALATLGAALLHGPALAALGQVGAFVAPLLVASDLPNYWALYIYLAVVTAAS